MRFSGFRIMLLIFMMLFSEMIVAAQNPPEGEWQFYRINAQYRGTVKKGFRNLGCAVAWFKDIDENKLQAIFHICALHPEKRNEKYSFRLNLLLKKIDGKISIEQEIYGDFTGIHGERQNQIRQLCCLWAYMREYSRKGVLHDSLLVDGRNIALKRVNTRSSQEITCSWTEKRDFSGKFFLEQAANNLMAIDKLRFRSGRLSVSLAVDSAEKINKDFGSREPFATEVFK